MKEYQEHHHHYYDEHSLRMQQQQLQLQPHQLQQRNSNHAKTASSANKVATAAVATTAIMAASATATTATQMRATLIYLAPFLHPCKNVVPGTTSLQETTTTSAAAALSSTKMLSSLGEAAATGAGETLQKTHVAPASTGLTNSLQSTSSSSNSSSISMSSSGNRSTSKRRHATLGCSGSSSTLLLHPGSRNNHNHNNAINSNSTIINASKNGSNNSSCSGGSSSNPCSTTRLEDEGSGGTNMSSSCCHNSNAAQQACQVWELESSPSSFMKTKKDNTKHKDKYYENYEMPALETNTATTRTSTNTTTMFYVSNNKIRQEQHEQQTAQHRPHEVEEGYLYVDVENATGTTNMKTDKPSLSACITTTTNSTTTTTTTNKNNNESALMTAVTVPVLGAAGTKPTLRTLAARTSFVNYTNKRSSTKYLRERATRHCAMQQHQEHQQRYLANDSTLQQITSPRPSLEASEGQRPLKQHKEFELQRTKSPCGRSVRLRHASPVLANNMACGRRVRLAGISGNTRPASRSIDAATVIDNHNTMKCYNSNNNQMANTSLLSRCHCLNMLSNVAASVSAMPVLCDEPSKEQSLHTGIPLHHDEDVIINDKHVPALDAAAVCGIGGDGHHNLILRNSSEACDQCENVISYPQNAFATTTETSSTPTTSSSLLSTTFSSSSPALPPSSLSSSTTSYTTILNKECRCFTNKRDIIIGSEMIRNASKALTSSSSLTIPTLSSESSNGIDADSSCWLINSSRSKNSSDTLLSASLRFSSTTSSSSPSRNSSEELGSLQTGLWGWASSALAQWLVALFGCSKLTKTVKVSKWLFMWLLFIVLSSSAQCWAGRNDVPTNCTFPARWEGSWFLSGYQQSIHIKGSQFSYRGRCAASDNNKYLIVDEKGCHRCLVIYEKHKNVLQYKESECEGDSMYMHQTNPSAMAMRSVVNQKPSSMGSGGDHRGGAHPNSNGHSRLSSSDQYIMRSNDDMNDYFCKGRETLQNLCDQIPGDALLYSLFRESADPVKCPLKGPFVFTYNRGNGECKSPASNIESCTEDSRLLLSFQACPDVVGTESTVEELTCLATWKDGNSRYLVGLVSHHHAISNEERYRCFVYEKISSLMDMGHFAGPSITTSKDAEYKLAQSGDATCNGLDSAEVGSRIMSLRKPPVTERCDFPAWFKGPRHWHVLMGNSVYNYHTNDGSIHIIKSNGYMDTRALCEQINKQTATEMMSVVHYTTGCQSGFMCMMFYRRDTHIIEIQTGKPASRLEDACAPDHFDINKTPYITLLASNPDPQICPMEGLYTLRGAIGPPYMTTRHKRNHNNKVHGIHNHHHPYESNERGFTHKRHTSLSFRNSKPNEKNAWHANTRGIPGRSRRDASSTTTKPNVTHTATQTSESTPPKDETTQQILMVGNSTSVGFVQDPDSDTRLRSRRNVPECITNYNAQRQLWIGCTEPNVIDVRPLCSIEGDEEYSCHGSWSENGTVYIIARHKGTKHGVCISYRPTEGNNAKLVVGDACYRGTQKPPDHHLEANLSVFGKCGETGSTGAATVPILGGLQLITAILLITLLSQLPIQR